MDGTVSPLYGEDLSISEFLQRSAPWKNNVLGALCFSAVADDGAGANSDVNHKETTQAGVEIPCMRVFMQRLDEANSFCEIWYGGARSQYGKCGDVHYRHDGNLLFGVIEQAETGLAKSSGKTPLQQACESAYQQIFNLLDALQYPYVFRFWNYMADINGHSFGMERYQQFNLGRQDAFMACERSVVGNIPAACALGLAKGPLTVAFLAGRVAPLAIENPRQVSAFKYPSQYGPRSPTFARACLARMSQNDKPYEVLFISGTASIVGHLTCHPDDVIAQTHETITNIEAILVETNRVAYQPQFCLADLHFKIYVRHAADLASIKSVLMERIGNSLRAVYLQADVCRYDLLVEIEAAVSYSLPSLSALSGAQG